MRGAPSMGDGDAKAANSAHLWLMEKHQNFGPNARTKLILRRAISSQLANHINGSEGASVRARATIVIELLERRSRSYDPIPFISHRGISGRFQPVVHF